MPSLFEATRSVVGRPSASSGKANDETPLRVTGAPPVPRRQSAAPLRSCRVTVASSARGPRRCSTLRKVSAPIVASITGPMPVGPPACSGKVTWTLTSSV
ncbi:hypothetical protein [Nannocystis pusilla]|uniref:hypothetical protein n=1 Tax=Nannocystis pusilla TaxID=889268 RepID=UPI003DA25AF4